jgi:hypothetical protein
MGAVEPVKKKYIQNGVEVSEQRDKNKIIILYYILF